MLPIREEVVAREEVDPPEPLEPLEEVIVGFLGGMDI
jgi:hypothetical protein